MIPRRAVLNRARQLRAQKEYANSHPKRPCTEKHSGYWCTAGQYGISIARSATAISASAGASARTAASATTTGTTAAAGSAAAAMRTTLATRRSSAAAATAGHRSAATQLDRQRVALELLAVHLLNGGLGLFLTGHLNEPKASGFPGSPIPHDSDCRDLAEGFKRLSHIILTCVSGEVPNINVHLAFSFAKIRDIRGHSNSHRVSRSVP
jgi:hypothetical protein